MRAETGEEDLGGRKYLGNLDILAQMLIECANIWDFYSGDLRKSFFDEEIQ